MRAVGTHVHGWVGKATRDGVIAPFRLGAVLQHGHRVMGNGKIDQRSRLHILFARGG